MAAQVVLAGNAIGAGAAAQVGVDYDSVPRLKAVHTRPNFVNQAGTIGAEDVRVSEVDPRPTSDDP
jgi:hypothetical protein